MLQLKTIQESVLIGRRHRNFGAVRREEVAHRRSSLRSRVEGLTRGSSVDASLRHLTEQNPSIMRLSVILTKDSTGEIKKTPRMDRNPHSTPNPSVRTE